MATNPATIATPCPYLAADNRWMDLHEYFIFLTKEREPDVVFIGDSHIQIVGQYEIWNKLFAPMHALNFGIGGDATQHILWRVQNGELENINPKAVVLCCGTNNHEETADQVAEGVIAVINKILELLPNTKIIFMGIPPRGCHPNPLREKVSHVNRAVASHISTMSHVMMLDTELYVQPDGSINPLDMFDFLHLTPVGYEKICHTLLEMLTEIIGS